MRLSQDCIAGFVILPSASKPHVRRRQLPPSEFSEGSSLILAEFGRPLVFDESSVRALDMREGDGYVRCQ